MNDSGQVGYLPWRDLNGSTIFAENDRDKATALLQFFPSVYSVEPADEYDSLPDVNNEIQGKMSGFVIAEDSIYSKLCALNISKSPGPDMLHPRVLYELKDVIAYL